VSATPPTADSQPLSPVDAIPTAAEVRQRLAQLAREAALLRQLLRVAVRRERDLAARQGEEVARAG
jgi:hypothetical protein